MKYFLIGIIKIITAPLWGPAFVVLALIALVCEAGGDKGEFGEKFFQYYRKYIIEYGRES